MYSYQVFKYIYVPTGMDCGSALTESGRHGEGACMHACMSVCVCVVCVCVHVYVHIYVCAFMSCSFYKNS